MNLPFAILLSGCGHLDGAEITESISVLIHLSRHGRQYRCFAPDAPQTEVINHATHKTQSGHTRNMMVEAARISRGDIQPLDKLDPLQFAGLILPGGFGAAKNLCDFAFKGVECTTLPDVERVFKAFHAAKKPIGCCCIAPVLAARILGTRAGGPGVKLTIGTDEQTAAAVATMGNTHVPRSVTEAYTDEANRLVTTPAYMFGNAKPHEVFEGIGKLVDSVVALSK
jgi:enhancing lycopene biosynthesis protein 2